MKMLMCRFSGWIEMVVSAVVQGCSMKTHFPWERRWREWEEDREGSAAHSCTLQISESILQMQAKQPNFLNQWSMFYSVITEKMKW